MSILDERIKCTIHMFHSELVTKVQAAEVSVGITHALTKAFCNASNAGDLFERLTDIAEQRTTRLPFELQNARSLNERCTDMVKCGCTSDNQEDWIVLGNFYRRLNYYNVSEVLFEGNISVEELDIAGHESLLGLYDRYKDSPADQGFYINGLLVAAGAGQENEITSNVIHSINQEISPFFIWPTEVLRAFFFEDEDVIPEGDMPGVFA